MPREMAMEKKLIEKSIKEWKKNNNNLVDDNGNSLTAILTPYSLASFLTHVLSHSCTSSGLQEYKEMKSFLYHLKQNPNQISVPQTNASVDSDNNKELSEIGTRALTYLLTYSLTYSLTHSITHSLIHSLTYSRRT